MDINKKYIDTLCHRRVDYAPSIVTDFFIEGNPRSLLSIRKDIRKVEKGVIRHKIKSIDDNPLSGIPFSCCKKRKDCLYVRINGCHNYLKEYIDEHYPECLVFYCEADEEYLSLSCGFPKERHTNYRYFIQEDPMGEHCFHFNSLNDLKYNYCRKRPDYIPGTLNTKEDMSLFLNDKVFFFIPVEVNK